MDVAEKLGIRGLHKDHSGEAVSRDNSPKKRSADAPVDLPRKRPCPDTTATRPVISPARLCQPLAVVGSSRNVRIGRSPQIIAAKEKNLLWKCSCLARFWRQYARCLTGSSERGCEGAWSRGSHRSRRRAGRRSREERRGRFEQC
jgi:hypothetical protein